MGFIRDIRFPITDGLIVTALRAGLTTEWAATVQPKLPDTKVRRMVTVRNDSGPQDGRSSRQRFGVNLWADSAVDALNMALDAMSLCRLLADGTPITATDSFAGPFEIEDDPAYVVGNKNLTHYYFTFRASSKGSKP